MTFCSPSRIATAPRSVVRFAARTGCRYDASEQFAKRQSSARRHCPNDCADVIPMARRDAYRRLYSHLVEKDFHCAHAVVKQMRHMNPVRQDVLDAASARSCGRTPTDRTPWMITRCRAASLECGGRFGPACGRQRRSFHLQPRTHCSLFMSVRVARTRRPGEHWLVLEHETRAVAERRAEVRGLPGHSAEIPECP